MADTPAKTPRRPAIRPQRSEVPVSQEAIPAAQRGGDWLPEVEFLKQNPGKYFTYEGMGASSVTYLRSTHGLDAKGRNTRTVDDNGNVLTKAQLDAGLTGRKVVDIYVAYVPELVEDIKAGRAGRKAKQNTAPEAPKAPAQPAAQAAKKA